MENMKLINTVTVGVGGTPSISFNTIPQTYTDLKILYSARTTEATTAAIGYISFNGSTSNFSNFFLQGNGATVDKGAIARFAAYATGTSNTADIFSAGEIYIPNYTSATTAKSFLGDSGVENNATTGYANYFWNLWNPGTQAAITSISLQTTSSNWVENSTFYLYGISNTIASGAKAYGGYVTEDATYWYHTFLNSGVFTPTTNLTCEYVTIAGGGGGGATASAGIAGGGGGGAGGFRTTSRSFTSGTGYVITVGAGGAGRTTSSTGIGSSGANSEISGSGFATWTSSGGGGGGLEGLNSGVGISGGSAGGNGRSATTPTGNSGGYSPAEGSNGGAENGGANGGGGGGAVSAGGVTSGSSAGSGGAGSNALATWATATLTGVQGYYAGGGGGGAYIIPQTSGGAGGLGGGGAGGWSILAGISGVANTGSGGGGGGAGNVGGQSNAGNGGSGIVILRYAK